MQNSDIRLKDKVSGFTNVLEKLKLLKELDEKFCTWKSDKDREIEALRNEINELRELLKNRI